MISRRGRWVLAMALVVGALSYLIVTAVTDSKMYYYTVDEVLAADAPLEGRALRLMGEVVGDSIKWDPVGLRLEFVIQQNGSRMLTVYHGSKPDAFVGGAQAILEGRVSSQGVFEAEKLMLSCPSKYEAAEPGAKSPKHPGVDALGVGGAGDSHSAGTTGR